MEEALNSLSYSSPGGGGFLSVKDLSDNGVDANDKENCG